jgi:hypothetical protein
MHFNRREKGVHVDVEDSFGKHQLFYITLSGLWKIKLCSFRLGGL